MRTASLDGMVQVVSVTLGAQDMDSRLKVDLGNLPAQILQIYIHSEYLFVEQYCRFWHLLRLSV